MCSAKRRGGNGLTPCRLSRKAWPVCYSDGCYMNYRCPVYRGMFPNPERDYVPLPSVFVLVRRGEAEAISYLIPVVADLD